MISCKVLFIVFLWTPPCFSLLSKLFISVIIGVVMLQLFALLQAPTTHFKWTFHTLLITFVVILHSFSCGCLPIPFVGWVSSYWSFSSTIFHKCRWWCRGYFATPSIVARFFNTLFQMNSTSCHLAFVAILPIVINDNGRCIDMFFFANQCNLPW